MARAPKAQASPVAPAPATQAPPAGVSPEAQPLGRRRAKAADLREVLRQVQEEGRSVRAACRLLGLNHSHVLTQLNADRWRDQYARARESRGEHYGELVLACGVGALTGRMTLDGAAVAVTPEAARAAMQAFQWAASRMAPKLLGDRMKVDQVDGTPWRVVIEGMDS